MKKFSLFKIALVLSAIGIFWLGYEISQGDKIFQTLHLSTKQTASLDLKFIGSGIGFYKISIPDFGDSVFIQIIDSHQNIMTDKKIETKMAINYFDFKNLDLYILRVTNLSDHPISVQIEFGDMNVSQIRIPGILLFFGIVLLVILFYRRMNNYKIAQPDENIS